MDRIALIDAPSNLGLRPPDEGVAPGVYKLPGALRDTGLLERLDAVDRGVVTPPRYSPVWDGARVRNEDALRAYTVTLAERLGAVLADCQWPLVLGGDCSVLIGAALALRRRGPYGLLFVDGHSDFRHLGNSDVVRSAAGEDLALVTGRGAEALVGIDGLSPYVSEVDVAVLGVREGDLYLDEMRQAGFAVWTSADVAACGARQTARAALERVGAGHLDGFWIHLDADVVDPTVFPAVDTPVPGGLSAPQAEELLVEAVGSGRAVGADLTILDPDLDPGGSQVRRMAELLVAGIGGRTRPPRPTADREGVTR